MVRHIVLWSFLKELTAEEKKEAGDRIKALLEPIRELVPGAAEIQVAAGGLASGNRDIALISSFETEEALLNYQNHPAHVEAGKYVRSVTCDRACMDYKY